MDSTICLHHRSVFLTRKFESIHGTSCCDPFERHKKPVKRGLCEISRKKSEMVMIKTGLELVVGKKLCRQCFGDIPTERRKRKPSDQVTARTTEQEFQETAPELPEERPSTSVMKTGGPLTEPTTAEYETGESVEEEELEEDSPLKKIKDIQALSETEMEEELSSEDDDDSSAISAKEEAYEELERNFAGILNTLKKKELNRPKYARRKLEEINTFAQNVIQKFTGLTPRQLFTEKIPKFIKVSVADLKDKILELTRDDICKVLTLLPEEEWSLSAVEKEFGVSHRMAIKARKEKREKGILPFIGGKQGTRSVTEDTEEKVVKFYEDDEISRNCPGSGDFVSVKKRDGREREQKRLLLFNLKEIYSMFKDKYPQNKISFSKFCLLRPLRCVTASSPGMHNVCVCSYHENVKLMIMSLPENKSITHRTLMDMLLCKNPSVLCHEIVCDKCPGEDPLRRFLEDKFDNNDIDGEDQVKFKEWTTCSGKTEIRTVELPMLEFVDLLVQRCVELVPHSYVAKAQSTYLKTLKESLCSDHLLIIMDFAQNFTFVVQDEVQGWHWNNKQCTIHPICIYSRNKDNQIICTSLCIISDIRKHDASVVHAFLHEVMPYIQASYPRVKLISYFSDGAGSQYKNKFNFLNLCNHENDFQIRAEWHFFATSHGKGACDGVGGTLKRLAARASLQNQSILTAEELCNWATLHVPSIKCFYVPEIRVKELTLSNQERLEKACTLEGTRKFHSFKPICENSLKCATTSDAVEWFTKRVSVVLPPEEPSPSLNFTHGNYVACYYLSKWWVGMVLDIHEDEADCDLILLHPHGPARSFTFPRKQLTSSVPIKHVICNVNLLTTTGRSFQITELEKDAIESKFANLKKKFL